MGLLAERTALREDAARLLDELGGTVSEVAVSLGSMGIQVRPSGPSGSPAARYLHAVIGADNRVRQIKVNTRWLVLKHSPKMDPGHLDATSGSRHTPQPESPRIRWED